ncbi:MAG: hypothetical protein JSU87_17305 [Gemmatimonadota bacterium]|nr:MAG: hypothetical protein JSU87_17305 [Gemmatimonadota bacterium]
MSITETLRTALADRYRIERELGQGGMATVYGRWQVSRDGGNEPLWAHSGEELFYRSGNGDLMAVAVQPGSGFRAGEPRALFSAGGYLRNSSNTEYNITPDDHGFVFKRRVGAVEDGPQTLPPSRLSAGAPCSTSPRTRATSSIAAVM